MYALNEIPHLKMYKAKVSTPRTGQDTGRNSILFLNGPTVEDSKNMLMSPDLINNNFNIYFMERLYHGKLFSRTFHQTINIQPEGFRTNPNRMVRQERSFQSVRGNNVFIELSKYNEFFFDLSDNGSTYTLKTKTYLEYLKDILSKQEYLMYRNRVVLTDVSDWENYQANKLGNVTYLDNPMMYIYYAMVKLPEQFMNLGDIDFVFFAGNSFLRVNPSKCDKESHRRFKIELSRVSSNVVMNGEVEIERVIKEEETRDNLANSFTERYFMTGEPTKTTKEIKNTIKEEVKVIEDTEAKDIIEDKESIEDDIVNSEDLASKVHTIINANIVGKSKASSKRDEELRKRQEEVMLNGKKLKDILADSDTMKDRAIESHDISDKVSTINKNVTKVTFSNFEKAYNKKLMTRDMTNMLKSLNKASIPVHIRSIKEENTSNEMSLKKTYTIELEDGNRVRHRLKFDMPIFIDDKFMYLNGNKKIIIKQLFLKPIVKIGPDVIQIVSNYNKIFLHRHGARVSSKIEKFKKAVQKPNNAIKVKLGNQSKSNKDYITTLEFDELARSYHSVKTGKGLGIEINFNMQENEKKCKEFGLSAYDKSNNNLVIGFSKESVNGKQTYLPIHLNTDTQLIGELDIVSFITEKAGGQFQEDFKNASSGKKYIYTRGTLMGRPVPLILLLSYMEGLSTVLRKAEIKHYFTDKRPKLTVDQGLIQFEDGFLVYDKYPFENSLLLNGLSDIPTRSFKYEEFDAKECYIEIFDILYKQRNIAAAFDNFYDFMIDPITEEVLRDLKQPTEFVDVMIYANRLLADNQYTPETDMNIYRVRSNEILNAYLYKAITRAYASYAATANNNNPTKISIPQDVVLKEILTAPTIEDYSILNPIVELEKARAITPKGPSGANIAQSFTMEKRSYSESMVGLMAMSTSPDANCGVVRELTLEPSILSARGYIETKDDNLDALKDANIFSPAELLSPLGASRDDTIRTAMAIKQSKHIIPVKKSSPVLISNGMEQTIHYNIGNDFSIVAKDDGEVLEINEETNIIIVKYKNGEHQAIDIGKRTVKNGAGGFYLINQLNHKLKVGQKFKKDDILAYDKYFFTDDNDGVRFNIGSLQKIAVMSTYSTYEDSTFITQKMAEDIAAKVTIPKEVTLGKNANIDYIVKVGDKVKVGDELIRFESSFGDDSINKFLSNVGEDLHEEIRSLGKKPILSKYSGEIVDIKMYSTVDLEEMSPSLQKVFRKHYGEINKKKKQLNKYDNSDSVYKMDMYLNEPTTKVETKDGKIKGNIVNEGVLIQIFIEYTDIAAVGDKITFFTALKGTIGDVVEKGYEPYTVNKPDEEISAFVAPGAVLARMTPSILLTMFGNKVLVELKNKLQEIYNK